MTREEIEAMPAGPEMDRLIAIEVLSWAHGERGTYCGDPFTSCPVCLATFSREIQEAWILIEDRLCQLTNCGGFGWRCDWLAEGPDERDVSATADTAPLAICRAALIALALHGAPEGKEK